MPKWDFSKLRDFYEAHVPAYAQRIVTTARKLAEAEGASLYLVGGGARELLRAFIEQIGPEVLENKVFDLDLCVVGDAIKLAEVCRKELGGSIQRNPTFLTAKLITPQGYIIDFTTARTEFYEVPGALPTVFPTENIYEDLLRRDFTVNALAVGLSEDNFGELLDPTGGMGDMFEKKVRVIHPSSFLEDPTRLFRAVLYVTRLNYRLEVNTAQLFEKAVEEGCLDTLSPERIRYELERILSEEFWFGMMWMLASSDILRAIHPVWTELSTQSGEDAEVLDLTLRSQAEILAAEMIPPNLIRLSWCLFHLPEPHLKEVLTRIGTFHKFKQYILEAKSKFDELVKRMNYFGFGPSRIYRVLVEYSRKMLLFAAFSSLLVKGTEALRSNIFKYLRELSPRRNILSGEELTALGVPQGPIMGKIQEELWWHFLDGEIKERADADKLIPELLAKYTKE